jgi:hypothetical protein
MIIVYAWFKFIYPLPSFFPDSYEYIRGAIEKRTIDYRPIGYAKFLEWFPFITRSHFWLVTTQYISMQSSVLYLLFSIRYLLQPGKWVFIILLTGCILNPLMYQVSNFVSSDPLFTALSLVWFTQLLWIIIRPTRQLLFSHTAVLFLAFFVRYNAIYYPVFSIGIVLLSQAPRWLKGMTTVLIIVSLGYFVLYTKQQFKKQTGTTQFSPFSGWQQVANALVAYTQVNKLDSIENVPEQFKPLHRMVFQYINLLHRTPHYRWVESAPYYLWRSESPLWQYAHQQGIKDSISSTFARWTRMAPLYNAYANYLIRQRIDIYIKYHILSNTYMYFKPFPEFLGLYNFGEKHIHPEGADWFNISTSVFKPKDDFEIRIIKYIPTLNGVLSVVLILAFCCYILMGGIKYTILTSKKILCCTLLILICNAGFNILAAPIMLRYQTFPFIVTSVFSVLLIEYIIHAYLLLQKQEKSIIKKETDLTESGTTYQTQPVN